MIIRCALLSFLCLMRVSAETHQVENAAELASVLPLLRDGDVLKIASGEYLGGNRVTGVSELTIEGLDPEEPPHFRGGKEAWHFTRTPGLIVRHLRISGQSGNGFNIDDGGERDRPVEGILLEAVQVEDIGPQGNHDGIKCSGLKGLTIRRCHITGWGGQAIDLVGCRDVLITDCRIIGKPEGFSQATGPQFKGGCEDITIENCHLTNAGARPIQLGGSTGDDYFRPPGATFEARRITVRNNVIEGGECAVAFTGVQGATFSENTIRFPEKWLFRVLWEKRAPGFQSTRDVTIEDNQWLFRRADVIHDVNLSEGSAMDTFVIRRNHWLAEDQPEKSKPKLPIEKLHTVQ